MFSLYALWQDATGVFWLQTTDGPQRSTDARSWALVPSTERTKWRHSPSLQAPEGGLVFRCSGEKPYKGSEAVRALGLRPGQSRSWGFRHPREVVLLPDGSVFYCGTIEHRHTGAHAAVEDMGLAALSRDGETWTAPYRHHCMNHASIVWDRGSRLVSVQEYGASIDHEGSGLAVSFCDIDRLGGRGEAHPTPLQVLSPAEHTDSSSVKSYFRNLRILQMTTQTGRFFCWGMNGLNPVEVWEIDPVTGAPRSRIAAAIAPPTVNGTSWSDTDGRTLWIATQEGGGLIAYSLATGESKTLTTDDGLVSNNVQAVRCYGGKVYAGTLSGLNILDPATGRIELVTKRNGMPDNSIQSIACRGTQTWMGTKANGVMVLDRAGNTWSHFPPGSGPSASTSAIFFEGDMAFCAGYGVHAYNTKTKSWTSYIDWGESPSPIRDGDLLWFPVWSGIYTLNLKTLEVRKHFIRSPSHLAWQTNPNRPNCLTIVGDKVLFATWGPEIFAASKGELLRNSFNVDEYKAMHRPASNEGE